ncbi:hypothetical protein B0H34DRAFT_812076 [Crassisporium funariophilum]|nr:hypothetical protein B0H34DRAFT_812076 [Crassisporium funariophilum]
MAFLLTDSPSMTAESLLLTDGLPPSGAAMATAQAIALFNALKNIRVIKSKLAATGGALTSTVFSTSGALPDMNLDNARAAIGLEFESLVQNIRAVKPNDPIATAYPDIHYNLAAQIARRNWPAHEYGTTPPIKWNEVSDSIYNGIPKIESGRLAALREQGFVPALREQEYTVEVEEVESDSVTD